MEHTKKFLSVRCGVLQIGWRVVDAIKIVFEVNMDITDMEELQRIERGFTNKSTCGDLRGVVIELDGCIIWEKNPGKAVENPNR